MQQTGGQKGGRDKSSDRWAATSIRGRLQRFAKAEHFVPLSIFCFPGYSYLKAFSHLQFRLVDENDGNMRRII